VQRGGRQLIANVSQRSRKIFSQEQEFSVASFAPLGVELVIAHKHSFFAKYFAAAHRRVLSASSLRLSHKHRVASPVASPRPASPGR
jgi:hypothetical protein